MKKEEEELTSDIKYDPRYKKNFTFRTHFLEFAVYTLKNDEGGEQAK